MSATNKGISLDFDPRYVEWVIQYWLMNDLAPLKLEELTPRAQNFAQDRLTELNRMGLREEKVSATAVVKAIGLLQGLGLLQKKKVTPRPPRQPRRTKGADQQAPVNSPPQPPYYQITATAEGCEILTGAAIGELRPELVRRIVATSPDLIALLAALDTDGPIIKPVRNPLSYAPTKGGGYTRAVESGIQDFWSQIIGVDPPEFPPNQGTKRPTAGKLLDFSTRLSLQRHTAAAIKHLDKLISLSAALGLVWKDIRQVNEVIAAEYVGSAASASNGTYAPSVPSWDAVKGHFADELVRVHRARANGSGYASIEALRGGLGKTQHLSSPVIDELLRTARDEGDRGHLPILLHFEPDEEALYTPERSPLVWRRHAFDFVEVRRAR